MEKQHKERGRQSSNILRYDVSRRRSNFGDLIENTKRNGMKAVSCRRDDENSRLTIVEVIRDVHIFLVGGAVRGSSQNDHHISAIRRVPFRLDVAGKKRRETKLVFAFYGATLTVATTVIRKP